MSERTLEQVTNEHNQLCYQAGMLQYRIKIEQAEVDQIFQKILSLNKEAAELNEASKKAEDLKKKEDSNPASSETESAPTLNASEAK